MFLLLCFVLAYGVMRLWEDATARWRHEPPPRHEYRMAKLKAREENGGKLPRSPIGRYTVGLLDDVWESAHERHELGAQRRREKREFKAKKKLEKQRAKQRAKLGLPISDGTGDPAPAPGVAAPGSAAPGAPGAVSPIAPPAPAAGPIAPPAAAGPAPSAPSAAPPNGAVGAPSRPPTALPSEPLGFYARVPQVPGSPLAVTSQLSPEQSAIVARWLHDYENGGRAFIPAADYQRLPADVRAAIMARVAQDGGQHTHVTETGQRQSLAESDPALANHLARNGIALPRTDAGLAKEIDAALERGEKPPAGGVGIAGVAPLQGPATLGQPVYQRVLDGMLSNGEAGMTDDEYWSLSVGERARLLDYASRGHGNVTHVDTQTGQLVRLEDWDPEAVDRLRRMGGTLPEPDPDVADRIARAAGFDGVQSPPATPPKPAVADTAPDPVPEEAPPDSTAKEESGATGSNVIPFPTVSSDAAVSAAVKEYPTVTTMTGESTGLDAAIQYAEDLEKYLRTALDGVTSAVPDPEGLATSFEQAQADLTRGGVRGETLASVTETQEPAMEAVEGLKTALANLESALGGATKLRTKLEEQRSVQEAYNATPDAGDRGFVSNGAL